MINVRKMLKDRGYIVPEGESASLSLPHGIPEPKITNDKNTDQGPFYKGEKSISLFSFRDFAISQGIEPNVFLDKKDLDSLIKMFVIEAHKSETDDSILIIPENLVNKIESIVLGSMEVFSENFFAYDPSANINVSHHSISDKWEEEDLPLIKISDPIVRWYGFHKGDVICIKREYCNEMYYRRCSE